MIQEVWNWLGENAAEIIAVCALVFTAYQAGLARKHNRLSVKPHLTTFGNREELNGVKSIGATIQNNGLGPAVIQSFQFELLGQLREFRSSEEAHSVFETIIDNPKVSLSISTLCPGHVISNSEKLLIFSAVFPLSEEGSINDFESMLDAMAIKVKYQSIYGECFEYHSINSHS